MPLNLILSYFISFIGVKNIYKDVDQRELISLGLFIGSITAFLTLIIYMLSKIQDIYIPIIFGGLLLSFEYYGLRKSEGDFGSQSSNFSGFETTTENNNKINMFLDEDTTNDDVIEVSQPVETQQHIEPQQNKNKLSLDDLINE
jgi:hypothetical protein